MQRPDQPPQGLPPGPAAVSPTNPPPPDDWTRFSPPPKSRIADAYADPARRWRGIQAGLALLVCCLLLWAMISGAGRDRGAGPVEPTRVEQRTEGAREFLRRHDMEEAPFTRAQEELARRRGGSAPAAGPDPLPPSR